MPSAIGGHQLGQRCALARSSAGSRDNVIVGPLHVAGIEATDRVSLEREFRSSIDVYLEGCEELQIDPIAPTPHAALSPQSA